MILIGEKIHASCVVSKNSFDDSRLPISDDGKHIRPFIIAAQCLLHGDVAAQRAAENFIASCATRQAAAGATWLDINVDEFSTDPNEREAAMRRFARIALAASPLPLSIDAADSCVILAGLATCQEAGRATLLNSVTPGRLDALELAVRFNANVVLLPTPDNAIPATAEARCEILRHLLARANGVGIASARCFLDPIVMPVVFDPRAVVTTLDTVRLIRETFDAAAHVVGGVSNVSYGLPARAIINRVFAHLFFSSGADAAILNPLLVTRGNLLAPATDSDDFRLAKNLLDGEDEYGVDYLDAFNASRLSIKPPRV